MASEWKKFDWIARLEADGASRRRSFMNWSNSVAESDCVARERRLVSSRLREKRRFPPPWTVEDFRVIPYDGWNGHVTARGVAVTEGENAEHDRGTCSHSDLSQMWCVTYRRRGFADYRYAQMPCARRYRHPQRTSGSDPSTENGKCFNGSVEKRR